MGKKWTKYYLLFGTTLTILLSAICSFTLVNSNILQAQDKKTFESIYVDTSIDFIVPSPSYTQVGDIEQSLETGIAVFTPYYETTTDLMIESKPAKGTTIIIPEENKVQYTPYGSSRMVSGKSDISAGSAVADRRYIENNNCGVGNTVSLRISDLDYTFTISGVAETNTYYNDGTIAVVLSEEQAKQLQENGLKYSAAYVAASDYEKCKSYLYTEYKPYGRLKEETAFDSKDAYNQHVQNFESADWTKEITNCKDNYSNLSVKYENVESGILRNTIIVAIIVFLAVIIFNTVLLRLEKMNKFLQGYLIKKGGIKKEIKSFYRNGIVFNTIAFFAVTFAFYYWIVLAVGAKPFDISLSTSLVMIVAHIIASIMMCVISSRYVERKYSIKRNLPETAREYNREASSSPVTHKKEVNNTETNSVESISKDPSDKGQDDQRSEGVEVISDMEETTLGDDSAETSPESSDED